MKALFVREYAKHKGVTRQAVERAIKDGRIKAHKSPDGRKYVYMEQADEQWRQNTLDKNDPARAEARRRREVIQTKLLQLKHDEVTGKLVDVDEVTLKWTGTATRIKNKLLAVPSRWKQRCPNVDLETIEDLDAIIRQALEELVAET